MKSISGDPQAASKGKLTATILSAYDLPDDCSIGISDQVYVTMTLLGKEVRTGPPSAKHRDQNSFKFVSENSQNGTKGTKNEISISAPLELLYPESVVFKVIINNETLSATVNLSTNLHINEMKWLILHLDSKVPAPEPTNGDQQAPTLRLKLCLSGPYRPEVAALISLGNSWFHAMDVVTSATSSTLSTVTSKLPQRFPSGKVFLLPTVPMVALCVVLLPLIFGVLTAGLPLFLPILAAVLGAGGIAFLLGSGVYLSSAGRDSAIKMFKPMGAAFLNTTSGQRVLYETGPRPSPVALAETFLPDDMIGQLVVSLAIDFIGSSSYLIPFAGEFTDLGWAPIQTVLLMAMYDKHMPSLKYISFIEETLPFTDVLPSGTLGWLRRYSPLVIEEGLRRMPPNIREIVVKNHLA